MKKIEIKSIGETIYYEKLDNGLELYLLPKKDVNNVYATFTTRYGGYNKDFLLPRTGEYTSMPNGIAHFLEHKMFEQEDKTDAMLFFASRGADVNAFTSLKNTAYLFYGPDHLDENLNFLLDYVQAPYFTDENVLKEKGIIEQEIKMYEDDPYAVLEDGLRFNTFVNHPIKNSIIGTVEDIYSINKELLYDCYHTFYHPSNMFLIVTGNFDVEHVIDLVQKNQDKKHFEKHKKIKLKDIDEPNRVAKEYGEKTFDVAIPKLGVSIKIPTNDIKVDQRTLKYSLYILFDILFGTTSEFFEKAKKEELIDTPMYIEEQRIDSHSFINLFCDTKDPNKMLELIRETIQKLDIDDDEINRKKNLFTSTQILFYENIKHMNHYIMNNIIEYGDFDNDIKKIMDGITIESFRDFVHSIDLSNQSVYIIKKEA